MMKERPFLLTRAQAIPAEDGLAIYDEKQDLSVDETTGQPIVLTSMAKTHSKTAARPGDDDPDPGQDRCY